MRRFLKDLLFNFLEKIINIHRKPLEYRLKNADNIMIMKVVKLVFICSVFTLSSCGLFQSESTRTKRQLSNVAFNLGLPSAETLQAVDEMSLAASELLEEGNNLISEYPVVATSLSKIQNYGSSASSRLQRSYPEFFSTVGASFSELDSGFRGLFRKPVYISFERNNPLSSQARINNNINTTVVAAGKKHTNFTR